MKKVFKEPLWSTILNWVHEVWYWDTLVPTKKYHTSCIHFKMVLQGDISKILFKYYTIFFMVFHVGTWISSWTYLLPFVSKGGITFEKLVGSVCPYVADLINRDLSIELTLFFSKLHQTSLNLSKVQMSPHFPELLETPLNQLLQMNISKETSPNELLRMNLSKRTPNKTFPNKLLWMNFSEWTFPNDISKWTSLNKLLQTNFSRRTSLNELLQTFHGQKLFSMFFIFHYFSYLL